MAQLVKKTPMELFGSEKAQVKPSKFTYRGSVVKGDEKWLPKRPLVDYIAGDDEKKMLLYNGTKAQTQEAANQTGEVYGSHNKAHGSPYYAGFTPKGRRYGTWGGFPQTKDLPYQKGYGHVAFPEQWKYKTGTELATAMTRAAKYDPEMERSWGPNPYQRRVEEIQDEIYGGIPEKVTKID